jgi:hypothetical protein
MSEPEYVELEVTWWRQLPGLKRSVILNTVTGKLVDDSTEHAVNAKLRRRFAKGSTAARVTKSSP